MAWQTMDIKGLSWSAAGWPKMGTGFNYWVGAELAETVTTGR
jgi:hypothetical protein